VAVPTQLEVCAVVMAVGEQTLLTEVTVTDAAVTVIAAVADLLESLAAVAVQLAAPTAVGVNTPEKVIVPSVAV